MKDKRFGEPIAVTGDQSVGHKTPAPLEKQESLRFYDDNPQTEIGKRVMRTYYTMHEKQTVDFVRSQHENWCKFDKLELTVMEALDLLNTFVDESDPDVDMPNSFHAFQTAERIREKHPDKDWLQLTGLIHDLGKIMGLYGQEQWCTVGDTYPVGMPPRRTIVYGVKSFEKCPDIQNPQYMSSPVGMYAEHCGMDNILMSWGHDEYLYQALKNHSECTLPKEGMWCIRYHSFYPWHDQGDYTDICNNDDINTLEWVKEFNQFDLYSKIDEVPDVEVLKSYYQQLVDKYMPGKIKF